MDVNTCFATTEAYRDLALYSHLIPILATMVLGIFAFARAQNRLKAGVFLAFTSVFSLWLTGDLINWMSNDYHLVAATWAPLDYINIVFFLLLACFVYADLRPGRFPLWFVGAVLALAAWPFIITSNGQAVFELYQSQCEMVGNESLAQYKLIVEIIVILAVITLGVRGIIEHWGQRKEAVRIILVTGSIMSFLSVFSGAERFSTLTGVYEHTLYSLFILPIFILFLTIAITSYGTFRLGDVAVKTLFYVFLALAGTQFFFVGDMLEFSLAAMSFVVVLTLGIMLFRTSEREIAARHLIEKQEQELEMANREQESLLHFISHEIKGYLTKSEAGFAAIAEGDYGQISDALKTMSRSALGEVRKGVATVMEILDASNFKKGTVNYAKKTFDLRAVVAKVVEELRPSAAERDLAFDFSSDDGDFAITGDEDKIKQHAIRNLIDNSIKYTPTGGAIHIKLARSSGRYRFTVEDNGVGITQEDMRRLFTEGGHGKDSIRINVHSTGYGLYIAKKIVESHGGKVWAESEGQGKGSRFIVELPGT